MLDPITMKGVRSYIIAIYECITLSRFKVRNHCDSLRCYRVEYSFISKEY